MNLDFDRSDNTAGLISTYYVPIEYIESDTGTIITLKPGRYWYICPFVKFSANGKDDLRRSAKGSIMQVSLSGKISKATTDVRISLETMNDRHFVVVYKNLNADYIKVGSVTHPLKFSFSTDTGKQPGNFSGATFKFTGTVHQIPNVYEGTLDTSDTDSIITVPQKVVSITWNGDTLALLQPGQTLAIESEFKPLEFKIL